MDESKKNEVIILAKGDSRMECPFDCESWGLNDVMELPEFKDKHVDLLFTFDPRSEDYIAKMKKHAPVISWRDYADIKYPLEEITKRYSPKYKYFSNTVSYMMAYALFKGFKKIRMYGVDAPFGGIYYLEKPGIEYWAGKAEECGVDIEVTEGSHVMRTKDGLIYGDRQDNVWLRLYLVERLCLLNALPGKGNKEQVHIINIVRNILAVKDDEAQEHRITLTQKMDGSMNFNLGKDEKTGIQKTDYSKPIWMPVWAWQYLANILIELERHGQLPSLAESVYEKMVRFGNADTFPAKPAKGTIKVSYIMPTKNRANYVKMTLENMRNSKLLTEFDEFIIVDGSTNTETLELCKAYSPMITLSIHQADKSGAEAFNKGVLHSRGQYIKIVPDDDVIFPEGMQLAVHYMDEHPEIDLLVCGGVKEINKQRMQVVAPADYGQKFEHVFQYGACGTGFLHRKSSFAKTGLLDPYDRIADQEFALRCIKEGVVRFLTGTLYLHPILPHSNGQKNVPELMARQQELIREYCPHLLSQGEMVTAGGTAK